MRTIQEQQLIRKKRQIFEMIDRIKLTLGWDVPTLLERLQLSYQDYLKIKNEQGDLPVTSLISLATSLQLSLTAFDKAEIDFTALGAHQAGKLSYLSEKYTVAAFSRKRTVINYLDYVEKFNGWRMRWMAMCRLQLTESILANPDDPVNLTLVNDLTNVLMALGVSREQMHAIGAYSIVSYRGTQFSKELAKARNPIELYEKLFCELLGFLEQNCIYEIVQLNDRKCKIEVTSRSSVAEALKVKHLGTPGLCTYKAGLFSSVPGYLGLNFAKTKEIACAHEGDHSCIFEVDLTPAYLVAAN